MKRSGIGRVRARRWCSCCFAAHAARPDTRIDHSRAAATQSPRPVNSFSARTRASRSATNAASRPRGNSSSSRSARTDSISQLAKRNQVPKGAILFESPALGRPRTKAIRCGLLRKASRSARANRRDCSMARYAVAVVRVAGGGQRAANCRRDHRRRAAFRWRGLMLDSARHYQSPEYIKQFIDWMALHKLNVLHWHLTDDQAWRLEIKKYPKLTSVGAWRVPAGAAARADIDPATGKPRLHGGFYTQDQVRDIVAHAASRHINVVPEIEMPGHATAAVVAYPRARRHRQTAEGRARGLGHLPDAVQCRRFHVHVSRERARPKSSSSFRAPTFTWVAMRP